MISELRHSAVAGWSPEVGVKGVTQVSARSVARMFVVVCRSFCAWRQTRSLSAVKVTSHSRMPAPIRAAATFDSTLCSGNCIGAPRWPMEKCVRSGAGPKQAVGSSFSGPSRMASRR